MSIVQFVPEVWAGPILSNLRETGIYVGLTNRDYEGEIANAGDTVHITSFTDPAVRDYVKNSDISWDLLSDATRALVVDQADYFAFTVDDVDRRQAQSGFVLAASQGAGNNLALEADEYVSGLMVAAVDGGAQDLGAQTWDISDNTAYGFLVTMRTKLNRNNIPRQGRWVVVPPEAYAALIQDPRFVNASASGTTETLREGFVGRIAGFDVYESNVTPEPTASTYHVIAGHRMAVTFADQIRETEAVRLQNQFGDGIRGLHLYGAKVVYPTALVLASVTVQA
jgi:hypothetical protein